jgi:hypothetical protein
MLAFSVAPLAPPFHLHAVGFSVGDPSDQRRVSVRQTDARLQYCQENIQGCKNVVKMFAC